jgi:Integral membrane protein S linking to the trans Golgi network
MARPNEAPDLLHWWEPRKIIIQMAILQAAYTLTATLLITLVILMMASPFRIDYFFLYQYYTSNNAFGLSLSLLSLVTALFT